MEPKTLSNMNPSEQQLKNRLLASSGETPVDTSEGSPLDGINTYNPQSIMDRYSSAKKLTIDSADATAKRLESEYSTAKEDINIDDTKSLTSTLESQSGFAQMPVALNYMQISHDKRIRDLTKQKNELLLTNDSDKAKSLSTLILNEETAISTARTNFLNNYFAINREKRDSSSFETPDQKSARTLSDKSKEAILALSQTAPDAGITSADDYNTAITKYKNSRTYQRNTQKGDLELKKIEADIRQSNAAASKSLSESNGNTGLGSTNPGTPTASGKTYNGDFAATIDLTAGLGGTNQERAGIRANMKNFITNGDYKSAYTQVVQATVKGLKGDSASTFQEQNNNVGVLTDLKKAIEAYRAVKGNTNIFKGTADEIQTKIGKLLTDPRYASLAVQLDMAFQNYRQKMTGAAFSGPESAEYAAVLPSKGNTMDLNLAKLSGAQAYLNSSINSSITSVVGEGGVHIKDYASGAGTPAATADKTLSAPATFQGYKLKFN